ncbi:MAG TPA: hypothetical protein VGY90_00440 [Steroidobacteraceae bacterium]|jgi:uncharacterized lipoprotein|nr:hypothetical protein [Steroidobacteraceae bacterium]
MKFARGIVLLILLLPLVVGCHVFRSARAKACHGPQPYQKSQSVPPLQIPAGLDAPDTTSALRLPALNEPAPPPRSGKQPCLDEPPPFKVKQPAKAPQA